MANRATQTSAQIVHLKPHSVNALTIQTKAAWDRADEKKIGADDWYLRTGKLLIELRAKVEHGQWLPALKKIGRGERRAQQLMEAAQNPKALQQQRERARKGMQKARAKKKSVSRYADLADPVYDQDEGDTLEDRWQNSLANICGDVIAIQPYWSKNFKGWEDFKCPSHIKKLVREAAADLAALAKHVNQT